MRGKAFVTLQYAKVGKYLLYFTYLRNITVWMD